MTTSSPFLVQLILATLICGQVLVWGKPQGPIYPSPSNSPSKVDVGESEFSEPDPSGPGVELGNTKGFEIKHGYSFNLGNSPDGSPISSGWTYFGGSAGPGPTYYADNTGFLRKDLWSGRAVDISTGVLYASAAATALGTLLYTLSPIFSAFSTPSTKSGKKKVTSKVTNSAPTPVAEAPPASAPPAPAATPEIEAKDAALTPDPVKVTPESNAKVSKSKKSRKRRAIRNQVQSVQKSESSLFEGGDPDLTRLASIVLNAIASGECLQKTICQLGTQIGTSPKGRMAFNLIDTLLPTSIHESQYFRTMKKALSGEEDNCERFNCQFQIYQ